MLLLLHVRKFSQLMDSQNMPLQIMLMLEPGITYTASKLPAPVCFNMVFKPHLWKKAFLAHRTSEWQGTLLSMALVHVLLKHASCIHCTLAKTAANRRLWIHDTVVWSNSIKSWQRWSQQWLWWSILKCMKPRLVWILTILCWTCVSCFPWNRMIICAFRWQPVCLYMQKNYRYNQLHQYSNIWNTISFSIHYIGHVAWVNHYHSIHEMMKELCNG